MALRQLMIAKKIEQRKASLGELLEKETDLQKRSADAEKAIEEAKTEEEIKVVEDEAAAIDTEKADLDEKKVTLEGEITTLEKELEELNEKEPLNNPEPTPAPESRQNMNGGQTRMRGNNYETREQMVARLERAEVKDFYTRISSAITEKRAVSGSDILIPEAVINMIQTRIGDYSTLYNEVTVQKLNGTARVIMDGAIPKGIWVEMAGALEELSTSFSQTELDGFKVGGYIPIPNSIIEDSMINLASYVETRLAIANAKALDESILIGTPEAKQPTGIIPSVDGTHTVSSDGTLKDIMSHMALIDDGEDGAPIGEVIAVMKRSTYYKYIAPQTYLPTADGRLVIQTASTPRLPDGTRIVFNQNVPNKKIVIGDFKKYLLGERSGIVISVSTDVKFIEDQTVFKSTARYDGKPVYPKYFVVITINDTTGLDVQDILTVDALPASPDAQTVYVLSEDILTPVVASAGDTLMKVNGSWVQVELVNDVWEVA